MTKSKIEKTGNMTDSKIDLAPLKEENVQQDIDDDIPAFLLLEACFENWPSEARNAALHPRALVEMLEAARANPQSTVWDVSEYEDFKHENPLTTDLCLSFVKECYKLLPAHRKKLVGLLRCDALFFKGEPEQLAFHLVRSFPTSLLSIEELHHFELLVPDYRPSAEGSIGHFNVYALLSIFAVSRLNGGKRPYEWLLFHWDSIGLCFCTLLVIIS